MAMSDALPIALDAMGGDYAPAEIVAGALRVARGGLAVCLVGDQVRSAASWPSTAAPQPLSASSTPTW